MFRKTYVAAKKEIDDWLRSPSYRSAAKGRKESSKQDNNQKEGAEDQAVDFDIK